LVAADAVIRADGEAPAGFLFKTPSPLSLATTTPFADANKTLADLVAVAPKSEGPAWRLQHVRYQIAPSGKGVEDQ
jgi:hypothetical protein